MLNKNYNKGSNLTRRLLNFYSYRNNIIVNGEAPKISFTFDDFPISAAENSGVLFNKYKINASYYVSMGLLGKKTEVGEIFRISDLERLLNDGHEIGDHSFDHHDALKVSSQEFEESILKNQLHIKEYFPELKFRTFAYPYGHLTFRTKKIVQKYYTCSRGIRPGINYGKTDLNLLKSNLLFGNTTNLNPIKQLIDSNKKLKGWLTFFTHDVEKNPSEYGCTTDLLEEVIKYSIDSGAEILSIKQACDSLGLSRD